VEPPIQAPQSKAPAVTPGGLRPADAISPQTKAILATLAESIPMEYANETPLDDVLKDITQATTTPSFEGIPIFVDPLGLQEAKRSLTSIVSIDLDGVPLKITLKLMLKQLGLAYTVKDGLLIIKSIRMFRLPALDQGESD
jgi:hypothetical protein